MKRPIRRLVLLLPLAAVVPGLAGCDTILPPPAAAPIPPKRDIPKEEVFSPIDYITKGERRPGTYRVVAIPTGETVMVQAVIPPKEQGGVVSYGPAETVHLAGILTAPTQPAMGYSISTIQGWVRGKEDLAIEDDGRFPFDPKGLKMVQIYFTPKTGPYAGKELNLNRMMIRSGYAVVDLYQATSIDLQQWLNDEVYARGHRGKDGKTPEPLGLWKKGIILGQRPAPPGYDPHPPAPHKPMNATTPAAPAAAATSNAASSAQDTG